MQGHVSRDGHTGLFDDVVGSGWQLLLLEDESSSIFDKKTLDTIKLFDMIVARFGAAGDTVDLDGSYGAWFNRLGANAVLIRPDFYIFGTSSLSDVSTLIATARAEFTGSREFA